MQGSQRVLTLLVLAILCQRADLKGGGGGSAGGSGGSVKQVDRRELAALVDDNDYVAALFLDAGQQFKSDRMSESLAKVVLPKMQVRI